MKRTLPLLAVILLLISTSVSSIEERPFVPATIIVMKQGAPLYDAEGEAVVGTLAMGQRLTVKAIGEWDFTAALPYLSYSVATADGTAGTARSTEVSELVDQRGDTLLLNTRSYYIPPAAQIKALEKATAGTVSLDPENRVYSVVQYQKAGKLYASYAMAIPGVGDYGNSSAPSGAPWLGVLNDLCAGFLVDTDADGVYEAELYQTDSPRYLSFGIEGRGGSYGLNYELVRFTEKAVTRLLDFPCQMAGMDGATTLRSNYAMKKGAPAIVVTSVGYSYYPETEESALNELSFTTYGYDAKKGVFVNKKDSVIYDPEAKTVRVAEGTPKPGILRIRVSAAAGSLKLRSSPGLDADVLALLAKGETAELLYIDFTMTDYDIYRWCWYKVKTVAGKIGYAYGAYCELVTPK